MKKFILIIFQTQLSKAGCFLEFSVFVWYMNKSIPDFVKQRYSVELKTILAIFWIALFTFVNLTTVLLLGSKALDMILGD